VDILDLDIVRFPKPVVYQDIPNFVRETEDDHTGGKSNKKDNVAYVVKQMIQELKTFINKDPLYKRFPLICGQLVTVAVTNFCIITKLTLIISTFFIQTRYKSDKKHDNNSTHHWAPRSYAPPVGLVSVVVLPPNCDSASMSTISLTSEDLARWNWAESPATPPPTMHTRMAWVCGLEFGEDFIRIKCLVWIIFWNGPW
jgi:hypothetical protein